MSGLSNLKIKGLKPKDRKYKVYDSLKLYILIMPNGSKYWRFNYSFYGKQKTLAIGVYPQVSLKEARLKREEARKDITNGIDPGEKKKNRKIKFIDQNQNTFKNIAEKWFKTKIQNKSKSYQKITRILLNKHLYTSIGNMPIKDITTPILLNALVKIEKLGFLHTTSKAKQVAGQIFRYAIITGKANKNPANDLAGALKSKSTNHFKAITDPKELGKALNLMDTYKGSPSVLSALQLTPLLFTRPTELRHMEWSEIDWKKSIWEIPAEKMKMKFPHIVPLCPKAIEILKGLERLTGRNKYVFITTSKNQPMSENTVRVAFRKLGISKDIATLHGFRATARTLLDEVLGYRVDWIEQQLAHSVIDPNGRAYNRTKYLKERAQMMNAWADYLESLKTDCA